MDAPQPMHPFPSSFDPRVTPPARVLGQFPSAGQYFDTMQANILTELTANMRSRRPNRLDAVVISCSNGEAWLLIPEPDAASPSQNKTLVRIKGQFYIVQRQAPSAADDDDDDEARAGVPPPPRRVMINARGLEADQQVQLEDYGYVGDEVLVAATAPTVSRSDIE